MASLVQLLCRTVKLAWMDHDTHRTIVDDCKVCVPPAREAMHATHCMQAGGCWCLHAGLLNGISCVARRQV